MVGPIRRRDQPYRVWSKLGAGGGGVKPWRSGKKTKSPKQKTADRNLGKTFGSAISKGKVRASKIITAKEKRIRGVTSKLRYQDAQRGKLRKGGWQ